MFCAAGGESTTERNTFYFHEQYKGKAGFEAHTQAPHFKVSLKWTRHSDCSEKERRLKVVRVQVWEEFAATEPFTKPPEVQFFEVAAKAPKKKNGFMQKAQRPKKVKKEDL